LTLGAEIIAVAAAGSCFSHSDWVMG